MKKVLAFLLALSMCLVFATGCTKISKDDPAAKGAEFDIYLGKKVMNLDPAIAYTDDNAVKIINLIFEGLFRLDEKGKVRNSLAEKYTVSEDKNTGEYYMYIYIKEDARWSDNIPVTADDVVFAWKRVLSYNESHEAAALLYDIKNARAYSEAEVTEDDIGLWADDRLVTIQFEGPIDYDQFILNLTSLALAPLREDVVSKNVDWAKKSSIMVSSGPFKLSRVGYSANGTVLYDDINYSTPKTDENNKVMTDRDGNRIYIDATEYDSFKNQVMNSFIIERNMYYYRNSDKNEYLDKSVTPYRILVDCSMSAEDIKTEVVEVVKAAKKLVDLIGADFIVSVGRGISKDPEKGIAMAYIKKANGDKGNYNEIFKPWCAKYYKDLEEVEKYKEAMRRSVYRIFTNSRYGMYGQYEPKCAPYVGDLDYKNEVETLKKQFEFVNKIMTDASLYPLPLSGLIKDDNVGIKKPEPVEPSCYDDEKYERALKYFETNMEGGPCDIPYCEDCGALLVAIEAIRRCLKKEKENA